MMDPSLEYSTLLYMCIECLSVAVYTRALHQFLPYYIGVVGWMAARPLVMPEIFNGDSSWDQWIYHFENVAVVND